MDETRCLQNSRSTGLSYGGMHPFATADVRKVYMLSLYAHYPSAKKLNKIRLFPQNEATALDLRLGISDEIPQEVALRTLGGEGR
jgi:hypothetical protein